MKKPLFIVASYEKLNSTQLNSMSKLRLKAGFTLIEMSIVLVIIGLIVGGILVGQNLIRIAENRAFVSQLEKYNTAVNTFRNKYACLPGDCANATSFGFAYNGNGNGLITAFFPYGNAYSYDNLPVDNYGTFTWYGSSGIPSYEAQNFWSELQSAGYIGEFASYTGGYTGSMPAAKNDGTGIIAVGWNGNNYYRSGVTGFTNAWGSMGGTDFSNNFSPADADYIFTKTGSNQLSYSNTLPFTPSSRIIPVGISNGHPEDFYYPPTQGTGGANANYCIDTSVSPPYFNVKNPAKLCGLIIQAGF